MNKSNFFKQLQVLSLIFVFTTGFSQIVSATITKDDVIKAQKKWGDGLVSIGKAYTTKKDYKKVAEVLIANLYGYQTGQVLFNPTKT